MSVYDDLRSSSVEVINELMTGQITVTRSTTVVATPESEFDPGATPTSPLVYVANACSFGITEEYMDDKSLVGDEILCIVSPVWYKDAVVAEFTPRVKDSCTINGEAHTCVKIERVPRDGVAVVWLLYLRAG